MIIKSNKYILNKLEQRIIDLSYKYQLSHIGSCLSVVRLIDGIYQVKKTDEPFILSNGHAALALYVVLEKNGVADAEELFNKHGVHPNRDMANGIWCTSGSLGHGIGIGVGMALQNRKRDVYVMTSDGEMAEGSCWEALRIAAENRLENLKITCIANGYGAYGKIDSDWLDIRLQYFYPTLVQKINLYSFPDWFQGQDGHYVTMNDQQYKELQQ